MHPLLKKALAEFVGTALLVCVVVGSGVMGATLGNNAGVALIINALSTMLALGLLIVLIRPMSGAHLNPAVTLLELLLRRHSPSFSAVFIVAQVAGAVVGAVVANLMFDLPAVQISEQSRASVGTFIGEVIATAGLLLIIGLLAARGQMALIPLAVPAWIGSAYFFTSSTSFANPAVTIGRMFSDTFAGIAPASVPLFLAAQLVGVALAFVALRPLVHLMDSTEAANAHQHVASPTNSSNDK